MDFNEIPIDRLEPAILVEIKANYRRAGIFAYPEKAVIVAQKLATGTLPVATPVQITRAEEAIALFGRGSIGAEMVSYFKKANRNTPLYVMALADAAGAVKATGTFTFTGAVSAASTIRFKINGRQVRITALTTDTVTTLATKLVAAINADLDLVATATSAAGVVTVTSRHGGEVGNEIDLRVDTRNDQVPVGLTIAVAAMSGGSGNPLLQTALDAVANTWFTKLAFPWSDATNMAAAAEWLRVRYLATSKLDCHGFVGKRGTFGELGTFGALTNNAFLTCMGLKKSPTPSWGISASAMGIAAFHLNNDPARQLRSLVLPGVEAPDPVDQFLDTENDLLLRTGISTFICGDTGSVAISRMITTYKTSTLGTADRAWLDIMVPATMSRIRYDWSVYLSLNYPRSKLVDDDSDAANVQRFDDDTDPGTAVVTPKRIKASWAGRSALYAKKVWIEDIERTVKESSFARSDDDRQRLEGRPQVQIVGNAMVFAMALEFQV